MSTRSEYADVLAVSCSICTILQFLSGTLVCQKFIQNGTTGDASSFPFVSGALSTSLWLIYGFMIGDRSVILCNTIGATLFFAYVITFYIYSLRKTSVMQQLIGSILFLTIVLIYSSYHIEQDASYIGILCCNVTLMFFAAPLVNLYHVIKTKSSESLPFPLIVMGFFVSIQWFLYGILIDDFFIQLPNFLGSVLSGFQLTLFYCFPKKYKQLEVL